MINLAKQTNKSSLSHALNDGEDFEIVFTVKANDSERLKRDWPFESPLYFIGQMTKEGSNIIIDRFGNKRKLEGNSFEHQF